MVICSKQISHQLNTNTRNLVLVLTKKWGRIISHAQCSTKILAPSKQLKLGPKNVIFPIEQEDICDYNHKCFMYSGLMIDDNIISLLSYIIEQKNIQRKTIYFPI